jgi:hypothetical protein
MGTQSLIAYVKANRDCKFVLGDHDCFTFTNGAWRVMHGSGYADDFVGQYADLGAKKFAALMKKTFGSADMIEALDKNMTRVSGVPPRGALVVTKSARPYFTGHALGIAMGINAVFVGENGLEFIPIELIDGAWVQCHRS